MWKNCLLGDVITLKRGYDLPSTQRIAGQYPLVSSSGITDYHAEYKVKGPGVVTGRYGTLGEVFYIRDDFWPLNTSLYVQDFKNNNKRFISYFLKTLNLSSQNAAGAVPGVNRNHLHQLQIRIPDLDSQNAISNILSNYDELIENNERRIQILEDMAQSLYREWFIHFRFPSHQKIKMIESPLGFIPQGWKVRDFVDCAFVHRGRSYRSSDLEKANGVPFVNLKCIDRDGGFRKNGLKSYSGDFKETHKVVSGDIVMAVTDMTQERRIVARCGLVPTLPQPFGVISMDLVKIDPKDPNSKLYIYALLRWSTFADSVKQFANGANVLHLSPDHIKNYKCLWPDHDSLDSFVNAIDPALKLIENLNQQNEILTTKRDLILPKLISGEIDLSVAASKLEEAA